MELPATKASATASSRSWRRRPYLAAAGLAATGLGLAIVGQEPLALALEMFGSEPLAPDSTIALAQPLPGQRWALMLVEQRQSDVPCWQRLVDGTVAISSDTIGDPNTCSRFGSSSNTSLRVGGNDLNNPWRLRLEAGDGELWLQGINPQASAPLLVARAPLTAMAVRTGRPVPLRLEPGWQLERRSYEGQLLSHLYLSNSEALPLLLAKAGGGRLTQLGLPPLLPPIAGNPGAGGRTRAGLRPLAQPSGGGAQESTATLSEVIALQVIPYRE